MSDVKCPYMNRKGYDDYVCNKVKHNVPYETYIKYCTEYYYDRCPNYTACYVATEVCNVVGLSESKKTYESLTNLRYNVMEKDVQYKSTLATYDSVGPVIVDRLSNGRLKDRNGLELDNNQIFKNLYDFYLDKVSMLVVAKKNKEAIKLYKEMINLLVQGYKYEDSKKDIIDKKLVFIK